MTRTLLPAALLGALLLTGCGLLPTAAPEPKVRTTPPLDAEAMPSLLLDEAQLADLDWTSLEPPTATSAVMQGVANAQPCDGDLSSLLASPDPRTIVTSVAQRGQAILKQTAIGDTPKTTFDAIIDYFIDCNQVEAPLLIDGVPATILNDLDDAGADGSRTGWFLVETTVTSAEGSQRSLWLFDHRVGEVLVVTTIIDPDITADAVLRAAYERLTR